MAQIFVAAVEPIVLNDLVGSVQRACGRLILWESESCWSIRAQLVRISALADALSMLINGLRRLATYSLCACWLSSLP